MKSATARWLTWLLLAAACSVAAAETPVTPTTLKIIATGDMHGWLEGRNNENSPLLTGGAAELLAYWRKVEGYDPAQFLTLSAGDLVTGPALATMLKGQPVIEAMNRMGYDATALGNHEFDYGLPALANMEKWAKFGFISANVALKQGGPVEGVPPFTIVEEQGLKIGVIGLTTTELPELTTAPVTAKPYVDVLRQTVREVRGKGADVVIVLAHMPALELARLALEVKELKIPLMIGGHSHELGQVKVAGVNTWVMNCGKWWESYCRADLEVDKKAGTARVVMAREMFVEQAQPAADPEMAKDIAQWKTRLDGMAGKPLGHTVSGIPQSWPLYNWVADTRLAAFPNADIALDNGGCLRQPIAPGPVSKLLLFGVMPFENSLYQIEVTGGELMAYLKNQKGPLGMAGITVSGRQGRLTRTGKAIDPAQNYKVIVNSFMYLTIPTFQKGAAAQQVSEDWRSTVLDWLARNPTTPEKPLETLIDQSPRITP